MPAGSATPSLDSVVLASFDSRRAAEHMLVSLGRGFRKRARTGDASALVVSGNRDGSLKLTQSRVLTGGAVVAAGIRVSMSVMVGFMGLLSTLKGTRAGVHAAHVRAAHVGQNERRAHEILAEGGPHAAILFVRCREPEMTRAVAAQATDTARYCWHGSLPEFLADLNPGSEHDWVRIALGEVGRPDGKPG